MLMEFMIGDKVMYPHRGAGEVIGVEHVELVDGFDHYYVIDIPGHRLTVRVPVGKIVDLGVRPVMTETKMDSVLHILADTPDRLPQDYKVRQGQIIEKLNTCQAREIAEAVRDLTWHEERAYLTKKDSELLAQGRELLAGEIAMVTGAEPMDAEHTIDATLSEAMVGVD
jgi:CarD family transcriptional regulator